MAPQHIYESIDNLVVKFENMPTWKYTNLFLNAAKMSQRRHLQHLAFYILLCSWGQKIGIYMYRLTVNCIFIYNMFNICRNGGAELLRANRIIYVKFNRCFLPMFEARATFSTANHTLKSSFEAKRTPWMVKWLPVFMFILYYLHMFVPDTVLLKENQVLVAFIYEYNCHICQWWWRWQWQWITSVEDTKVINCQSYNRWQWWWGVMVIMLEHNIT